MVIVEKESLKIPQWQSEYTHRKRKDNKIIKRKKTKGQTTIYKTLHRKPNDRTTRT